MYGHSQNFTPLYQLNFPINNYVPTPQPYVTPPTQVALSEAQVPIQNPEVWGEAFWFMLHTGTANMDVVPDVKQQKSLIGFIEALPLLLPCHECSIHAKEYIASRARELPRIVKSQRELFKFFVDFHNSVNTRNGKPLMTESDALLKYRGQAVVRVFGYL